LKYITNKNTQFYYLAILNQWSFCSNIILL